MKNFNIIVIVGLFLFIACNNKKENAQPSVTFTSEEKSLITVSNSFGLDLFKTFNKPGTDSNLFISPLSISQALSMAYNGAEGTTKNAFEQTLRLNTTDRNEINEFNKKVINAILNSDRSVNLGIANSIWYKLTFKVLDTFLRVNQEYYNAEVNAVDFNNPATVNAINKWASDKTNGLIPQILNTIPPYAVMYLINAIYFKGSWKYQFDKTKTSNAEFYKEDGSIVNQQQMQQQSTFNYYENNLLQLIELPYGNGNFSMYVLLPINGKITDNISSSLTDENWKNWCDSLTQQKVVVELPKFQIKWGNLINDELINMGLGVAFDSNNADFRDIDGSTDLQISRVIHNTFIEVNEEGTEAAAVTVIEIGNTLALGTDSIKYFTADRPFIFMIKENTTGCILFIGKVVEPVTD